ncbi:MAG: hypothetical protein JKX85_14290 [Phycisphaeraceae bacterium]|nr:hypothetical protein [Phycisphaeraceae bacterium]
MIYVYPDDSQPIRQGDIFLNLPRIDISLDCMITVEDDSSTFVPWEEIATPGMTTEIIAGVKSVAAIVITQDCDNLRNDDISLCEICKFEDVHTAIKEMTDRPAKWVNVLTEHARKNLNWFYLPPDKQVGFSEKKAVDFQVTMRLKRLEMERLISFRVGRLNNVADEHFRERLSEYFRRYPYDEWYPFDKDELEAYETKRNLKVKKFPWQS